jgi:hypothetical protein
VRRRALLDTALTGGLAGCAAGYSPGRLAERGEPSDICAREADRNPVRAVENPVFGPDWDQPELPENYRRTGGLTDDRQVIGVEADGEARAYPLAVLRRHEVVNDRLGGSLLVTYCPLCRSGLVADREVDGRAATFGVSGLLWRPPSYPTPGDGSGVFVAGEGIDPADGIREAGTLLLYDDTGSRWSQLLARAVCGPRTGERLRIRPATVTAWGAW